MSWPRPSSAHRCPCCPNCELLRKYVASRSRGDYAGDDGPGAAERAPQASDVATVDGVLELVRARGGRATPSQARPARGPVRGRRPPERRGARRGRPGADPRRAPLHDLPEPRGPPGARRDRPLAPRARPGDATSSPRSPTPTSSARRAGRRSRRPTSCSTASPRPPRPSSASRSIRTTSPSTGAAATAAELATAPRTCGRVASPQRRVSRTTTRGVPLSQARGAETPCASSCSLASRVEVIGSCVGELTSGVVEHGWSEARELQ